MSTWAVRGNYLYVFDGAGRRYMSNQKGLVNTEVGFPELVGYADLTAYLIEEGHKLKKLTGPGLSQLVI
jgi:hypothetical protein